VSSAKTIVVVSQNKALTGIAERILKHSYTLVSFSNIRSALDYIYNSLPSLIILDTIAGGSGAVEVLNDLKEDPIFSQLPVLAVVADATPDLQWDSLLAEDYIRVSDIERELIARADLSVFRSERVVELNPLTKLPGNISINRQIQMRIDKGEVFAIGYADLDHFKPFNDYYGFSRGDEVIKMTGRLIMNIVKSRQPHGSFAGHIGGDDFVFIMDTSLMEETAAEIIDAFSRIVPTFYDAPDTSKGYIQSKNRQGNVRMFPIMTVSIGITDNRSRTFSHYGEMTEAVSEMKHYAKNYKGSCYKIDKRRYPGKQSAQVRGSGNEV
jgi:diguanylate cyclase (GGDEF)-like protein